MVAKYIHILAITGVFIIFVCSVQHLATDQDSISKISKSEFHQGRKIMQHVNRIHDHKQIISMDYITSNHIHDKQFWLIDNRTIHDCITGDAVGKIPPNLDTVPYVYKESRLGEDRVLRKESFRNVFRERSWGNRSDPDYKGLIASGPGSTLHYAQEMIATLHAVINQIRMSTGKRKVTLLDTACGDMAWMQRFLMTRDDIVYKGLDIVPEIIESHKKSFAQFNNWQFENIDVLDSDIGPYDLVISRMVMQHLYNADVSRILQKISSSGSKYLLMTSFAAHDSNRELNVGNRRFRTLNMELPPFQLTPPICLQRDGLFHQRPYHFMGLWKLPLNMVTSCEKVHLTSWKDSEENLYSCAAWTDLK